MIDWLFMLVSGSMIECICRDQDEEVSRILEEKQRLIAEILQESVQNLLATVSPLAGFPWTFFLLTLAKQICMPTKIETNFIFVIFN